MGQPHLRCTQTQDVSMTEKHYRVHIYNQRLKIQVLLLFHFYFINESIIQTETNATFLSKNVGKINVFPVSMLQEST